MTRCHLHSSPPLRIVTPSVSIDPGEPRFEDAQWIVSGDANVARLLDIPMSTNPSLDDVWNASFYFLLHPQWHKPRPTILESRIEGLLDRNHSKPRCLFELPGLLYAIGNYREQKCLPVHRPEPEKEWGDDIRVADTLVSPPGVNRPLGRCREEIQPSSVAQQPKKALEIYQRL